MTSVGALTTPLILSLSKGERSPFDKLGVSGLSRLPATGWYRTFRELYSATSTRRPRQLHTRTLLVGLLAAALLLPGGARAQVCVGDCDDNGRVTVDELIRGVNIALGELDLSRCSLLDANDDDRVVISELVLAVTKALDGCTPSAATPTITPTPSVGATSTSTQTPTPTGVISIADAVARDAQGVARRLGERITTEGVVTVSAAVFANGKLKIFAQGGDAGIMVYHQTSAAVEAFQAGERLRVTGVIRQADPTGGDNPARGTILVDLTNQPTPSVLSSGNPLPTPVPVTLSELAANGVALTGTLVRVTSLHKVEGEWPKIDNRSTPITVENDGGMTATMRFQRLTITPQLSSELEAIGDERFAATAVVVQDDSVVDDGLLSGFQLWPRGADDIDALTP